MVVPITSTTSGLIRLADEGVIIIRADIGDQNASSAVSWYGVIAHQTQRQGSYIQCGNIAYSIATMQLDNQLVIPSPTEALTTSITATAQRNIAITKIEVFATTPRPYYI